MVEFFPKFTVGVEAGWLKRTKINAFGEYNNNAGSHELPEAEAEIPTPQSSSRRRRPIGQKAALRMARGSASRSQEVQSEAPSLVTPELSNLTELQMTQVIDTLAFCTILRSFCGPFLISKLHYMSIICIFYIF